LASFVPEDDEYLKAFSSAGFMNSPSLGSGEDGSASPTVVGLAQSLVKPSTLGLDERASSPAPGSMRKISMSSSIGGAGSGAQSYRERKSFSASPLKRKIVAVGTVGRRRGSIDTQRGGGGESIMSSSGIGGLDDLHVPGGGSAYTVEDVPIISDAPACVEVDEAFVDTWADTLLDERSSASPQAWPTFALYQLKTPRTVGYSAIAPQGGHKIEWIIVEQYVAAAPLPLPAPSSTAVDGPMSDHEFGLREGVGSRAGKRSTSPGRASVRTNRSGAQRPFFWSGGRNSTSASPANATGTGTTSGGRKRLSLFFSGVGHRSSGKDVEEPLPALPASYIPSEKASAIPAPTIPAPSAPEVEPERETMEPIPSPVLATHAKKVEKETVVAREATPTTTAALERAPDVSATVFVPASLLPPEDAEESDEPIPVDMSDEEESKTEEAVEVSTLLDRDESSIPMPTAALRNTQPPIPDDAMSESTGIRDSFETAKPGGTDEET
jgi:hypothetical protein